MLDIISFLLLLFIIIKCVVAIVFSTAVWYSTLPFRWI